MCNSSVVQGLRHCIPHTFLKSSEREQVQCRRMHMSRKEPNISQKKPLKGINFKIIQAQGLIKTSFIVGCNTIIEQWFKDPRPCIPHTFLRWLSERKQVQCRRIHMSGKNHILHKRNTLKSIKSVILGLIKTSFISQFVKHWSRPKLLLPILFASQTSCHTY